jgi:aminopeptidase N
LCICSLCISAYNSNWDIPGQIVYSVQSVALELDASQYSHPIVQDATDPEEIEAMFDMISYDKGCSILRMLSDSLGMNNFQLGLHNYLSIHAYGNAASIDLWNALQTYAPNTLPISITEYMNSYTSQMGYPLVTFIYDSNQPNIFTVKQSRFLLLPYALQDPALRDFQIQYKWDVLIRYISDGQSNNEKWLRTTDESITIPYTNSNNLFYGNIGRYGYYRVNYINTDGSPFLFQWDALSMELRSNNSLLSNADRCGLIDDAWTFALTEHTQYSIPFNISDFLSINQYNQYTPWATALKHISKIKSIVSTHSPQVSASLNTYVIQLINNNYLSQIPWNPINNNHMESLLQQLFVSSLIAYGDNNARGEAQRLWNLFVQNGTPVPVDIRDAIYRVGIEDGGMDSWNFLFNVYLNSLDASEQARALRGLSCSLNVTQLSILLDLSADMNVIAGQDQGQLLLDISNNPVGYMLTWEWIESHWSLILDRFGYGTFGLAELVSGVVSRINAQEQLDRTQTFFADKPMGSASNALIQAYEQVYINIHWINSRLAEFESELRLRMS